MKCCNYPDISRWVPGFIGWTDFTPVIPKMYWNVKSAEQRVKTICEQLHKLICYADMLADKVSIDHADIVELQTLFEKFQESGFNDYYAAQVEKWINEHMSYIFGHVVKQIYFGLTLDGHFVAYIPDGWSDILFDTGMTYGEDTYGRLILRWDVDESGDNVNQRPEDWS